MTDDTPRASTTCLQCERPLQAGEDRVETDDGSFCPSCFEILKLQLSRAQEAQAIGVNYPSAAAGGLLGGALGAAVWWGFTVLTKISFGLVAIVIGYAVGWGVRRFAAGRRTRGLQFLAAGIAAVAYFFAQYQITRTFTNRYFAEEGRLILMPFLPGLDLFLEVMSQSLGLFDVVFLAIAVFEAWRRLAPWKLRGA